jgi:GNAT superfamily N-acetyltransferase
VAEHKGEVIGFALWFLSFSTWEGKHGIYLEDLYVRPDARGAGHGRALLAGLARICVQRGYARLEWAVLDWNSPALGFYASLGAAAMDEWSVHRLAGSALRALAAAGPDGARRGGLRADLPLVS